MCTIVVGSSILTAWPPSDAARVAGFFLAASGYVTGIMWVSYIYIYLDYNEPPTDTYF